MKIKRTIGRKLALAMLVFNMVSILLVSLLFYNQFREALNQRVLLQLTSIKKLKRVQIVSLIHEKIAMLSRVTPALLADPQLGQYIASYDTLFLKDITQDSLWIPGLTRAITIPDQTGQQQVAVHDLSPWHTTGKIVLMFVRPLNPSQQIILITQGEQFQRILQERTGMGETGESYLVGADTMLRSTSRFYPDLPPTTMRANPAILQMTEEPLPEAGIFRDYRGVQVFSSFSAIHINGLHWYLLSEIDQSEALMPLYKLRRSLLSICLMILLVVTLAGILLARNLVKPVVHMQSLLNQLATGRTIPRIDLHSGDDEIARMYVALNKLVKALNDITRYANEIGTGNFAVSYTPLGTDDTLGLSLLHMRDQLKTYQENEAALMKQAQRALLQGQEKERMRLARELHDGLGPLLTTLKLSLQSTQLHAPQQEKMRKLLDETISEVRTMSHNLMPGVLLDFGVGQAIGNLVAAMQKATPVVIRYSNDMQQDAVLTDEMNIQLYRIVQEALNNAIRHAQATEIKLSLTGFEEYISFYISDNGQGFDTTTHHGGTGLINLRQRTMLLNGTFDIHSDSNGTSIEIELPLPL